MQVWEKRKIRIRCPCQDRHRRVEVGKKRIYLSLPHVAVVPVFLLLMDLTSDAAFRCPKHKQKPLFMS